LQKNTTAYLLDAPPMLDADLWSSSSSRTTIVAVSDNLRVMLAGSENFEGETTIVVAHPGRPSEHLTKSTLLAFSYLGTVAAQSITLSILAPNPEQPAGRPVLTEDYSEIADGRLLRIIVAGKEFFEKPGSGAHPESHAWRALLEETLHCMPILGAGSNIIDLTKQGMWHSRCTQGACQNPLKRVVLNGDFPSPREVWPVCPLVAGAVN
jgi:hypothetical protein